MIRVVTFGTYDLFHVGHLRLLERARMLGDHLSVGISTDDLNFSKKGVRPSMSLAERMSIVAALRMVDAVFVEESLDLKRQYLIEQKADILVMGDDWAGKFDYLSDVCRVVCLPRTPDVSSTQLKQEITRQYAEPVLLQQPGAFAAPAEAVATAGAQ